MLPDDIKLEHHLHLRLGHAQVVVDGSKPRSDRLMGRYDVLVCIDERPLLLFELKASDVPITDDVVRQGLAYARIHEPMVPITVATNGTTTRIHRSYDGAAIDPSELAADRLHTMLSNVTALAASATHDAVLTVLGSSTAIWQARFREWTRLTLDQLMGSAPRDHQATRERLPDPARGHYEGHSGDR